MHTTTTITAPVSLADVNYVLGAGSLDVGTLCQHKNINKWAKYKPVRFNSPITLSDADFKSVNFGINTQLTTKTQADANNKREWTYEQPNQNTDWKRITDFNGYDSNSTMPLVFGFSFDEKEKLINTITQAATSVAVKVSLRRNSTTASNGVGLTGFSLADLNVSGVTTGSFSDYVPCVTSYVDSALYVANCEDTIGGKYGTDVNSMAINLSNFTIWNNAWVDDSSGEGYPANATEKKKMTLYPRINMFTPSAKGAVYEGGSTTKNKNGYYTSGTNVFIGVPDATPLVIKKYKKIPFTANYSTCTIQNHGTWPYILSTDNYNASGVVSAGGTTLPFKTSGFIMDILVYLTNTENYGIGIQARGVSDTSGIFNKNCSCSFIVDGTPQSTLTFAANEGKWVTIRAQYAAGAADNYTFASFTSPSYGQARPKVLLRVVVANGTADDFNPTESTIEELRWR